MTNSLTAGVHGIQITIKPKAHQEPALELAPCKTKKPDLTNTFNFVKGTSRLNFTPAAPTISMSLKMPFKSSAKRFFEILTVIKLFYSSMDWSVSISTGAPRIYIFPVLVSIY